jgi:hypothetical protein
MGETILLGWMEDTGVPVRILAVVGGAAVGALLIGFLANVLARMASTRKLPDWARNIVRVLGAVASGWVTALMLFGGGGPGAGGAGGWGIGSNTGKASPNNTDTQMVSDKEKVVVEILGPDPLKRLGIQDPERCYRVMVDGESKELSLHDVKKVILERLRREPSLRQIDIVQFRDSPADGVKYVSDLKTWTEDLKTADGRKVIVNSQKPNKKALDR